MGIGVIFISIMDIVGGYQGYVQFPAHLQQFRVHLSLFRISVILKFQKIIALPKACLIFPGRFPGLFRLPLCDISLHFPRQAGRQGYESFMILIQDFHIHTGLVIIPLCKAFADNFHQILITDFIFRQQHKMIISVFTPGKLLVKPGIGRYINLTSQNGLDARFLGSTVEIYHTIHNTVICNGSAFHPQFFHPGNVFFDFIRTVQKGIFRVDVKMYKWHNELPSFFRIQSFPTFILLKLDGFVKKEFHFMPCSTILFPTFILFQKFVKLLYFRYC